MVGLHRCLVDYDIAVLRALAQNRGIPLTTNRQARAVDQLAAALLDPLSIRLCLARLSPGGREALEALLTAGGRLRASHFARRFGQVRPMGPGRLAREGPWENPANPAEELWYAGLIFQGSAQTEAGPGEFILMPDDLLALLSPPPTGTRPGTPAGVPAFALEMAPGPPDEGSGAGPTGSGGPDLIQDLFTYLVHLQTHDVRTYVDGRRRDLATVQARLIDPDPRRFALLRHLAEAGEGRLGLAVRQGRMLRLESGAVKQWLTASPAAQLASLQEAWRSTPDWIDLCHVPGLFCDREANWLHSYDSVASRQAFLAQLARCPLAGWWSLASFVAAVRETDPDFQRPDGDYTSWYIRDAETGDYLSGFESWDRVEGALIADLLTGPLVWLGIVEAAVEPAQALRAAAQTLQAADSPRRVLCRLTEAGASFLGLTSAPPEPAPPSPIVVHPDFGVDLPAPTNLYARFQLERFADLQSTDPGRYRLTVGGLSRALARGIQVEQVLAFLQQASGRPVPANVAGQLRLWAGRLGQVQLEEVVLLETKSEQVLKELSVLPETRPLLDRLISPTAALIRKKDLPRLQRALRILGYLAPDEPSGEQVKRG